jgi:hypothetical protein
MPLVFIAHGIRYLFYSDEGSPREPIHVHARRAECEVKVWVEPMIRAEQAYGFNSREVRDIIEEVRRREGDIRSKWNEHFSS